MASPLRSIALEEAYTDLRNRTLSRIPCDLSRLIYLASTRDYNSGAYHHEGLARQFREDAARQALEMAHREMFYRLSAHSLEELVEQLEQYVRSSGEEPEAVLRAWQKIEPYRVVVPMEVDPTVAQLFLSNVRLALAILQLRKRSSPARP